MPKYRPTFFQISAPGSLVDLSARLSFLLKSTIVTFWRAEIKIVFGPGLNRDPLELASTSRSFWIWPKISPFNSSENVHKRYRPNLKVIYMRFISLPVDVVVSSWCICWIEDEWNHRRLYSNSTMNISKHILTNSLIKVELLIWYS